MTTTTFDQVQNLIDQLTPLEQVRLLAYLAPRIVRNVVTTQTSAVKKSGALPAAWQTFFRIGDELVKNDQPEVPTLTQTVSAMRR